MTVSLSGPMGIPKTKARCRGGSKQASTKKTNLI
jgi:hypothetical protein